MEKKKIFDIRREIEKVESKDVVQSDRAEDPKSKEEKISQYQEKYLPDYLRGKKDFFARTLTRLWTGMSGKCEKEGTENIPEKGPYVVIGNHFGGGDSEAILQAFENKNTDLHLGVGREIWWNSPMRWAMKKIGMIPIEESLANLTETEKEEALERQGDKGKQVFRKIIDREKAGGVAMNKEFVRQAVATLLKGDAVGVFPEGLWLKPEGPAIMSKEHKEMKQGYRGVELIAKEYKKITGEDLPIIPTAYIEDAKKKERKLIIGEILKFSENPTALNGTDWAMSHVAQMLPEEQRGYYKERVRE